MVKIERLPFLSKETCLYIFFYKYAIQNLKKCSLGVLNDLSTEYPSQCMNELQFFFEFKHFNIFRIKHKTFYTFNDSQGLKSWQSVSASSAPGPVVCQPSRPVWTRVWSPCATRGHARSEDCGATPTTPWKVKAAS